MAPLIINNDNDLLHTWVNKEKNQELLLLVSKNLAIIKPKKSSI